MDVAAEEAKMNPSLPFPCWHVRGEACERYTVDPRTKIQIKTTRDEYKTYMNVSGLRV
jgi:hypothetical protein